MSEPMTSERAEGIAKAAIRMCEAAIVIRRTGQPHGPERTEYDEAWDAYLVATGRDPILRTGAGMALPVDPPVAGGIYPKTGALEAPGWEP